MTDFLDVDAETLHSMGYAQELARRMSGYSNFAISLSIICIPGGCITSFPTAIATGSGFEVAIGWLVGGLFSLVVAAGLAQIGSAYPTAGGLYHWSSTLGGRGWGWATAWMNLLGLVFLIAAVDVGVYTLFQASSRRSCTSTPPDGVLGSRRWRSSRSPSARACSTISASRSRRGSPMSPAT